MVDKELPVYVMTLIAMCFAVAWQLCYPRKYILHGKTHCAFSPFLSLFFLVERNKHTLLLGVFSIFQNDTSKNSFLYQIDLFYFGWTGSGLCYKGSYAYGAPPPAEEPLPSGKLYIKGTWTVPFLHEVDIIHGFCFSYIRSIYFLKEKRHHCFFGTATLCVLLALLLYLFVFCTNEAVD